MVSPCLLTLVLALAAPVLGQNIRNTAQLQTNVREIQRTTTTANTAADEFDAVSDAVLVWGTKCGPQYVTGWTKQVDWWRKQTTVGTTTLFDISSGFFNPPVAGYYHVCAYSRFQQGGNAVEMCIRKAASTRVACYGNAVDYEGGNAV